LTDIELLIKVFETGMMRRSGIRCDMNMCARVAAMLEELKERRSNDVYSDKR
jgi:recombinational DNA repair protein (RecF pathway)